MDDDTRTKQERDQDEFVESLEKHQGNPAVQVLEHELEAERKRYATLLEASRQPNPEPRPEGEPRRPNIKAANAGLAFRSVVRRRHLREALDLLTGEGPVEPLPNRTFTITHQGDPHR